MTEVLRRHKFVIIILSLLIFIAFLTFTILIQKPDRIPSKGIFVINNVTLTDFI